MTNLFRCILPLFFIILQLQSFEIASLPLSTRSRWIIDEKGVRIKLVCVNWPSHLETIVAEGLNKFPVSSICKSITSNGFNCVRFTWPVDLPTNDSLASTTIETHFEGLGLVESIAGIKENNPKFLNFTLIEAYQNVVSVMGNNGLMVILDNHVSKAQWCCMETDGNGFFGDKFFNPELWLSGLWKMASLFKDSKHVIGMSLRNELRGPNQNSTIWRKFIVEGAEIVHRANPDALVIVSGLSFDKDLSFVKENPLNLSFTTKLVYEVHWYGITYGRRWENENSNDVCGQLINEFSNDGGFLLSQGFPLFASEFGGDQRGTNVNDNRFLNCMFSLLIDLDMDWGLWTLQGSYYLRQGVVDMEETYGVLTKDWNGIRNQSFMTRINAIQPQYQGPSSISNGPWRVIFHPLTGLCIKSMKLNAIGLDHCNLSTKWEYTTQRSIMLEGSNSCLSAVGVGQPPKVETNCGISAAKWDPITSSKMHLSSTLSSGTRVCLDFDQQGVIVTNICKCLEKDAQCDPASQWFKIVMVQTFAP